MISYLNEENEEFRLKQDSNSSNNLEKVDERNEEYEM